MGLDKQLRAGYLKGSAINVWGSRSCPPQPLQPPPLTSTCFLRGLRSLTILAFLAGFFSSRSLSPSPLEELAEALLSNLGEKTRIREQPEHVARPAPNPPSPQQPAGRAEAVLALSSPPGVFLYTNVADAFLTSRKLWASTPLRSTPPLPTAHAVPPSACPEPRGQPRSVPTPPGFMARDL